MRRSIALAALGLLVIGHATAADWPQWRGPNRDGVSQETGLLKEWPKAGPKLAWKATLGGVGYSSPVVVGGRVYLTAAEDGDKGLKEFAICLGAKDGKPVWKVELPSSDGGYSTSWGSGPRSTPTIDGDLIYILGARGDLSCRKTADGSAVWAVSLTKDFGGNIPGWGYSESVLIDGDKLVCTPGGNRGTILALDKKTGKKLWQSADPDDKENKHSLRDSAAYASIMLVTVGDVRMYVTQTASAAVGVNSADGKLLWRLADLKRAIAVIPTPVVADNLVFFTSGYGAGCEIIKLEAAADGTVKATAEYRSPAIANHHGGIIRIGDHLYGHTDRNGRWFCYEFKKGGEDMVWDTGALDKGSLTVADGMLYCYGERKGTCVLAEASPEVWKEKGRIEIPEKSKFPRRSGLIWTHPVVANGKLYLRDHELLFCYEVAK